MNPKRTLFWSVFLIVLALIVWGLAAAIQKAPANAPGLPTGTPAPVSASDHVTGPADAPVTLIEYSDFQCPACEAYYPLVTQVLASSTVPIRFVYRHFPLSQHPNAIPASLASEAAAKQGKFWQMYDQLFINHADWTELPDPTQVFAGYAAKIGLDTARFATDVKDPALMSKINADQDDGTTIGLQGTPTFFVNGKAIANPQSYEAFTAIIDAAAR